jgi:hypothetical protein
MNCGDYGVKSSASTNDTTSHEFKWELVSFGDTVVNSVLRDVSIINDTMAYAVGEIYLNDSLGKYDPVPYNAALWNGTNWIMKRLPVNYRNKKIIQPLDGVICFSPKEIWLVGSLPIYGNGITWTMYDLRSTINPDISVSMGWGISSRQMYFVGKGGSIIRFVDGSWEKIYSNSTLDYQDIYGVANIKTGETQIVTIATQKANRVDKKIITLSDAIASQIISKSIKLPISSVWFVPNQYYVVAGNGIYEKSHFTDNNWSNNPFDITRYYIEKIRGNAENDIFAVGAFGEIVHYNGKSWKSYKSYTELQSGSYGSIDVKGDLAIAVGKKNSLAIVAIGKRSK